jgi:hypothetical protein
MQSAFGTPNTTDSDFVALLAEAPTVSFEHESQDLDLMTGQVGAAPETLVGRRKATLTFKLPLEGFVSGYDPTSEDPGGTPAGDEVIPTWFAMLANAMGSNNSAVSSNANFLRGLACSTSQFTAGGMASGTATTIVCDNATASDKIDVGQLAVASASTTSTSPQIGWSKTKSGQTVTLFEAAKNDINDPAANLYGTATAYASSEVSGTNALTFRWTGPETVFCVELLDAVCEKARCTWNMGEVPTIEFTYKCYNFQLNKADGGLGVPKAYNRIPQLIGTANARTVLMAESSTQCGLEDCAWEWSATLEDVVCHGADSGVSAVNIVDPRISAEFSIPHDSSDNAFDSAGSPATVGQHVLQSAYERQDRMSVGVYVGSQVGRIWAFLIPSGTIPETPNVSMRDKTVAYSVKVQAASYTGDTSDTAETTLTSPIDSIARMALA